MARKNIKKGLSTLLVTVSLLSLVGCRRAKNIGRTLHRRYADIQLSKNAKL